MIEGERLLCLDPGLRGCGVASFMDGRVERAWYARNTERNERGPVAWRRMAEAVIKDIRDRNLLPIHTFITEYPQVYPQKNQIGDQDDIIQLACVAGAVSAHMESKHYIGALPRQWKGQTPKRIHNARVVGALTDLEKKAIEITPDSLRHNIIDAIGLGLFVLDCQGTRFRQGVTL